MASRYSASKTSSNPISIGGAAGAPSTNRQISGARRSNRRSNNGSRSAMNMPHSCPPLRYQAPHAPLPKPSAAPCEPPPMELPPSPPIFTDIDVQKEIARRQAQAQAYAHLEPPALQPLSRSLNDFQYTPMSMPSSFLSRPMYAPSFGAVAESSTDATHEDSPVSSPAAGDDHTPRADGKRASPNSEDTPTIFSMMRKSSMSYSSPPSITRRLDAHAPNNASTGNDEPPANTSQLEDDLMFALSFDQNEESHMLEDEHSQQHQSNNYSLNFRD
jgi:hypothetical protein